MNKCDEHFLFGEATLFFRCETATCVRNRSANLLFVAIHTSPPMTRPATIALAMATVMEAAAASGAPPPPSFWNCTTLPRAAFEPVTLTNTQRTITAKMIPYGATITHLLVKDRAGADRDILLGWDDPTEYCSNPQHGYFGATIGRVANRIANCSFKLDGKDFPLSCNEGNGYDTLHGGLVGWDRRVWTPLDQTKASVTWQYRSPAGEMGAVAGLDFTSTLPPPPSISPCI